MKRLIAIALLALPLAACETSDSGTATNLPATAPQYGSTADIADFQGARAGQAEGGLNAKGYQYVRAQGLTSFWWNAGTQTCARIVTSNGRFSSVTTASNAECNQPSAAASGVVPGRATLAQVEQACIGRVAERARFSPSQVKVTDSTGSSEGTAVFLDADGTGWVCRADGAGNITSVEFQD